jgi:hypothetical protein
VTRPLDRRPAVPSGSVAETPSVAPEPPPAPAASPAPRVPDRRAADALRRAFDALVLSNPLYELEPQQATPEAVAALRESRRRLLPSIARLDYERAMQSFEMGEYRDAIYAAEGLSRLIEEGDFEPPSPGMRDSVRQLVARARAALADEDSRIYTVLDAGVTPPLALGRQMPAAAPAGLSSDAIGKLELLITRDGSVEAVKLHTPLNRFHERMIVSAAKAWRYQPATLDGRTVRYRLFKSVNLPEN